MLRGAFETGDVSRANSIASLGCLLARILLFGRKKNGSNR